MRKPFQGVTNIVRFNWHYYVLAVGVLSLLIGLGEYIGGTLRLLLLIFCLAAFISVLVSLLVSYYVYDRSNLYSLDWLGDLRLRRGDRIININAGFDETSDLLHAKFPESELIPLDFYDAAKHTEVSIARARMAYPPFPGTVRIKSSEIKLESNSADAVFTILSVHEIRGAKERAAFFLEVARILKPDGKVYVTEHLRDLSNILVYNIGAFHFHSRRSWKSAFDDANLRIANELKITPFISTFILEKYGASS